MMSERKRRRKRKARRLRYTVIDLALEYANTYYPQDQKKPYCRVGKLPPDVLKIAKGPQERKLLSAWRPWVHTVVITQNKIILVWGMLISEVGAILELKELLRLAKHTPEFKQYRPLRIEAHLVSAIDDPLVRSLAKREGLNYVPFLPPQAEKYLSSLPGRKREGLKHYPQRGLR
jgi:hypothetical protein